MESNDLICLGSFPRAVVHVDCDAFFTSCEQARNPALKGRPVITGKERGIVSCASYEAKAKGVQRGVRLGEVRTLCPDAVIIPSDYELYSIYSQRLFAIMRRFTPEVEEYSIDEAFADLTGLRRLYRRPYEAIALAMKQAIQKELDITASVGLSLTRTLAKICSKHRKPDGFVALPGYQLHTFLKGIPLERVCGFGPNTTALLIKCGVRNVLEYIQRPRAFAEKLLGKVGVELWLELRGVKVYEVSTLEKERYLTISKTKTFMPASGDRGYVVAHLMRNLESACIKLRRHRLRARNLTVYLRRQDFSYGGMEGRLSRHSSSTLDFTGVCSALFQNAFEAGVLYRSTGVIIADIVPEGEDTGDLFDCPARIMRIRKVSQAVDAINAQFGKHTLHLASTQPLARTKDHPAQSEGPVRADALHPAQSEGPVRPCGQHPPQFEAAVRASAQHPRNEQAWRKVELLKGETFRKRLGIPLLQL